MCDLFHTKPDARLVRLKVCNIWNQNRTEPERFVGNMVHSSFALVAVQWGNCCLQLRMWRCFCAACCALEAKLAKVAIQDLTGDTFREDVGWIAVTLDLEQGEVSAS